MMEDGRPFDVGRVCTAHQPSVQAMSHGVRCTPYRFSVGGHPPSVAFLALLPLLLATGCDNRSLDQARQEMREARATIEKLKLERNKALEEAATIRAELHAVRQARDELQKHMDQLARERDQASMFAQHAQEAISRLTTQENYQSTATATLQKQLTEMKTLVEEQQKLIEQLHKEGASPTVQAASTPSPPEPNDNP